MKAGWTFEQLDAMFLDRWNARNDYLAKRPQDHLLLASEAPQPLYCTDKGCLTHIVRFTTPKGSAFGVCGNLTAAHLVRWVDPADETFGCHLCIAKAEAKGRPTYSLIPDDGCSATDGKRYRPRVLDNATKGEA